MSALMTPYLVTAESAPRMDFVGEDVTANPSGFEKFMAEAGPMPKSGELDMDHLLAVCSRYHIDILGPQCKPPSAASRTVPARLASA